MRISSFPRAGDLLRTLAVAAAVMIVATAPNYTLSVGAIATPIALVLVATVLASVAASRMVNRLEPTELLRDE